MRTHTQSGFAGVIALIDGFHQTKQQLSAFPSFALDA
jgi:hypothetical protein